MTDEEILFFLYTFMVGSVGTLFGVCLCILTEKYLDYKDSKIDKDGNENEITIKEKVFQEVNKVTKSTDNNIILIDNYDREKEKSTLVETNIVGETKNNIETVNKITHEINNSLLFKFLNIFNRKKNNEEL